MADTLTSYQGRGPDGDFSIDLPAWATEATQAKVLKQLDNMNKNFKNLPKDMGTAFKDALKGHAVALKDLNNQTKKQTQNQKKKNESDKKHQSKTQKAQDALTQQMFGNAQALKDLEDLTKKNAGAGGGSLLDLAGKAGPLSIAFNALSKVTGGLFGILKGFAGAILGITGLIGREFFKVFNLLNDSLAEGTGRLVGAFTDAPVNIGEEASKAGLSIKEFGEALARNSEEIIVLGTQGFRELRNQVVDMQGGFYDMGFSQEQITEMLGREISIRARLGVQLDESGRDLGNNVRQTAQEVRMLGNAAGINAEILYEAGKQTDETNALIAARARQFGNVGINALSTSVRTLAMRITALSPTFGQEVSKPLIDAMLTGAVGLDSAFTDLVTVMPGLVDVFQKGRDEIMRGNGISENTIDTMVERLADVSEQEFNRAKMLALMTRNQNALNLVNFASEARARNKLLDQINAAGDNMAGDTLRSAATISRQFEIFLDTLKAPFENAVTTFVASFLGVNLNDEEKNLGDIVRALNGHLQQVVANIPILNKVLTSDFFTEFNNLVETMFGDGSETEKADARARLNALVTDKIVQFGDILGKALAEGNLGETIVKIMNDVLDDIAVEVYEATGFLQDRAFAAYIRGGEYEKAEELASFHGSDIIPFTDKNETQVSDNLQALLDENVAQTTQRMKAMGGTTGRGMPQVYKELYNLVDDLEGASDSEMLKILQDEGILRDDATEKNAKDLAQAFNNYYSRIIDLYSQYSADSIRDMIDDPDYWVRLNGSLGGLDKAFQNQDPQVQDLVQRAYTGDMFKDINNTDFTSGFMTSELPFGDGTASVKPFTDVVTDQIISNLPVNQQGLGINLLENFLNHPRVTEYLADGIISNVEARVLLGGEQSYKYTDADGNEQVGTRTSHGMLDSELLLRLESTEESNRLVREELVKFLRKLDKDNLINFSYNY